MVSIRAKRPHPLSPGRLFASRLTALPCTVTVCWLTHTLVTTGPSTTLRFRCIGDASLLLCTARASRSRRFPAGDVTPGSGTIHTTGCDVSMCTCLRGESSWPDSESSLRAGRRPAVAPPQGDEATAAFPAAAQHARTWALPLRFARRQHRRAALYVSAHTLTSPLCLDSRLRCVALRRLLASARHPNSNMTAMGMHTAAAIVLNLKPPLPLATGVGVGKGTEPGVTHRPPDSTSGAAQDVHAVLVALLHVRQLGGHTLYTGPSTTPWTA